MPSRSPLITIVVPVFNVEGYIQECLESIASQTCADFECIVVDDGSTDASGQIAEAFAANDARFQVFHKENGGVGSARNVGLDNAHGAYIGFVDSDDVCMPEMFEKLVRYAQMEDASIVACDYFECIDGSVAHAKPRDSFCSISSDCVGVYEFWSAFYAKDLHALIYVWNKLFKRELFETIRFREHVYFEDNEIIERLVEKAGRVAIIREQLYFYRRRAGSITKTKRPGHYLSLCEMIIERVAYFEQKGWQDLWDENALYLISRVARTYEGIERCRAEDQQTYTACRAIARKQATDVLRRRWRERRFLTKTVPFLMGEGVYLRFVHAHEKSKG